MMWPLLVDIAWKGVLLVGLAWALTAALRRASAATRHLLWTAAMAGLLLLPALAPLLSTVLPMVNAPQPVAPVTLPSIVLDVVADPVAAGPAQTGGGEWIRWAELIWLCGVALLAVRLAVALLALRRLIANASPAGGEWERLAGEIAPRLGLRRRVRVLASGGVTMPVSCGIWRHTVLVPERASEWPEDRRRIVLWHEIAHAARLDPLTQILAQAACSVHWFNPLAWAALRRMTIDREKACDDRVLASGAAAYDYAGHLVEIARTLRGNKPWLAAAIAMASRSQLEPRLLSILDRDVRRRAVTRKRVALAALAAGLLVVPLAAMRTRTGNKFAGSGVSKIGVEAPAPAPPRTGTSAARETKSTVSRVTRGVIKKENAVMTSKLATGLLAGAMAFGASVTGSVYDPSAAVVQEANVILTNTASGAQVKAKTGADGRYEFLSLIAGPYELRVEVPGFKAARRAITLQSDTKRRDSFLLEVGNISESLTVTAPGTPRPQASTPQRIRVGGNLQASRLLKQPRPVYPEAAKAEGREGLVELMAVIGKNGSIISLTAVPGADPDLVAAAADAVRRWQYEPTLLNGEPVEVMTKVDVNFKLSQ